MAPRRRRSPHNVIARQGPIGLPTRMVIAALGGMGAATVCHPLDTLRVNLQVDTAGRYTGMADAAVKITKRSGVSKGLYAGLTAAYLRQWTYGACRVGIYSFLLDKFKRDQGPDGKAPSIPQRMGKASSIDTSSRFIRVLHSLLVAVTLWHCFLGICNPCPVPPPSVDPGAPSASVIFTHHRPSAPGPPAVCSAARAPCGRPRSPCRHGHDLGRHRFIRGHAVRARAGATTSTSF